MSISKSIFSTIVTGLATKAKSVETTAENDLAAVKSFISTTLIPDAETIAGWAEMLLQGKVPVVSNPTLTTFFEIIVRFIPFIPSVTVTTIIADITEGLNYLNDISAFIALL